MRGSGVDLRRGYAAATDRGGRTRRARQGGRLGSESERRPEEGGSARGQGAQRAAPRGAQHHWNRRAHPRRAIGAGPMKRVEVLGVTLAWAATAFAQGPDLGSSSVRAGLEAIRPSALSAHVRYLADDLL